MRLFILSAALIFTAWNRAASYDAVKDFSTRDNPNQVWTYGQGDSLQAFTPLPHSSLRSGCWSPGRPVDHPYICVNATGKVVLTYEIFPPDVLKLQPARREPHKMCYAMLRFLAPATSTYVFDGRFETISINYGGTTQYILLNGAVVFQSVFRRGHGQLKTFHLSRRLHRGDSIIFAVSPSPNEDDSSDGTGVAVHVTEDPFALWRPFLLGLLAVAMSLGLFWKVRKSAGKRVGQTIVLRRLSLLPVYARPQARFTAYRPPKF